MTFAEKRLAPRVLLSLFLCNLELLLKTTLRDLHWTSYAFSHHSLPYAPRIQQSGQA